MAENGAEKEHRKASGTWRKRLRDLQDEHRGDRPRESVTFKGRVTVHLKRRNAAKRKRARARKRGGR